MNSRRFLWRLAALALASFAPAACHTGGGGRDSTPISLGIAAADFNGDGRADIAVPFTTVNAAPPHPSSVSVLLAQGGGGNLYGAATAYGVGNDTWNIVATDVDGDGLPDIVTVDTSANTLSLLVNDPRQPGHFQPARTIASGTFPQQVVAADIDQDGHADLVEAFSGGIAIHLQDPAAPGTFLARREIALAPCCGGLAIGDLNGDGLPDIAVADQGSVVSILYQDPAARGTFLPSAQPLAGVTGSAIIVADLDGDGANDLAYAGVPSSTGPSSTIVVALADKGHPGQFLPPETYATEDGVNMILVADLDGDGRADLVVGANSGVSILLQDAAHPGHFLPALNHAANTYTDFAYIALADVNGDGRLDIVVSAGPSYSGPGVMLQLAGQPGQFGDFKDLH